MNRIPSIPEGQQNLISNMLEGLLMGTGKGSATAFNIAAVLLRDEELPFTLASHEISSVHVVFWLGKPKEGKVRVQVLLVNEDHKEDFMQSLSGVVEMREDKLDSSMLELLKKTPLMVYEAKDDK